MSGSPRLTSRKGVTASAQGRVVRYADIQPEQAQDRAREPLGLTQRQMEHQSQGQHQLVATSA